MVLFEITGDENNPIYQEMTVSNGSRQYDFLRSVVGASLAINRPFLSASIIKSLNFLAITCLHAYAGQYRPCGVTVNNHNPPEHHQVDALMEDFVNYVNRNWNNDTDPVTLASYVLWRLNHIHPFINGNGRTARAACYFVLCVMAGQWLPGTTILPELIRRDRDDYVKALEQIDASSKAGKLDITPLHSLLSKLLEEQLASTPDNAPPATPNA